MAWLWLSCPDSLLEWLRWFAAPHIFLHLLICQLFIISSNCSIFAFALFPSRLAQAEIRSANGVWRNLGEASERGKICISYSTGQFWLPWPEFVP